MEDFLTNPFKKFDKDWALLTAGTKENFNAMTISWGAMGTLWFKPVIMVFVRPDRHTFNFLMQNDGFTVSFYKEDQRQMLSQMGTTSGRNTNKIKNANLTPKFCKNGITFNEATETFFCKKIYVQKLDFSAVSQDIKNRCYQNAPDVHYLFVGEVLERQIKK